jgi:two-component system, NarL family, nitrate/nitrite response regulator NarL
MQALLVDDHALFREGMKHLLRHLRPDVVVFQAASVREATDILTRERGVDLVLLDLQLPGMKGLQALNAMRDFDDEIPIVVLTGTEDGEMVRAAIERGAMGFIQKSVNPDEMLGAVETVLAGKVYLPESVLDSVRGVAEDVGAPQQSKLLGSLGITGRRAEVLVHLAKGKPTKVIARELGISDTTVKTHIQAVYDALNVHSRTQAIYVLARHGWALADIVH